MYDDEGFDRRKFFANIAASVGATGLSIQTFGNMLVNHEQKSINTNSSNTDSLGSIKQINAGDLNVGYAELGPTNNSVVMYCMVRDNWWRQGMMAP